MSAPAAASGAEVTTAPGASTSTVSAIFAGSPEPATSTRYPAATASRARTVPTLPAPRIPMVCLPSFTVQPARMSRTIGITLVP